MFKKMFLVSVLCLVIGLMVSVPVMGMGNRGSRIVKAQGVTVVGQDNPAVDVPAVQAAVDGGGTVYLSGTFDFGQRNVVITKGVNVIGETGSSIKLPRAPTPICFKII